MIASGTAPRLPRRNDRRELQLVGPLEPFPAHDPQEPVILRSGLRYDIGVDMTALLFILRFRFAGVTDCQKSRKR